MGPGQPARHAPERDLRHERRILVAVRKGPPLAGPGEVPDLRAGLPLLHHPAAPAGGERLRHPLPGHRRPVAPDEKRGLSAGPGGPRLPPEGLVALRGGARLESQSVFPDGEDAHRLPRLRRGRQDQFHSPLPCARGGAERGDPAKINQINQTKPLRACVRTSRVPLEGACNLALLVL